MINIRLTHSDLYLTQLAEEWCNEVDDFLNGSHSVYAKNCGKRKKYNSRLEKEYELLKKKKSYKNLSLEKKQTIDKIFSTFKKHPTEYVTADYEKIEMIKEDLEIVNRDVADILKNIFEKWYNDFTKKEKISYKYLKKLNIRTCPYCNRNYSFTIQRNETGKFKTRPEFDHFYNKSEYPLLALSFFNLVPSCHTCNHSKLTKETGINPYFNGFKSKLHIVKPLDELSNSESFNINELLKIRKKEDFSVAFDCPSPEEKANINAFGLHELYNEHKDIVVDIIDKANAYNAVGAQNLVDSFQGAGYSPKEVFDFVWGKNLNEKDFINTPLAKFTNDILEQLEIKNY